jgi:hypothetical protein
MRCNWERERERERELLRTFFIFVVFRLFSFFIYFSISVFFYLFDRNNLQWVMASSFTRFLDHTQRRAAVGRTPLDEWSARRRDLYLTSHSTRKGQTSIPPVGFEPAVSEGERPQTHALDRAATGTGIFRFYPSECHEYLVKKENDILYSSSVTVYTSSRKFLLAEYHFLLNSECTIVETFVKIWERSGRRRIWKTVLKWTWKKCDVGAHTSTIFLSDWVNLEDCFGKDNEPLLSYEEQEIYW